MEEVLVSVGSGGDWAMATAILHRIIEGAWHTTLRIVPAPSCAARATTTTLEAWMFCLAQLLCDALPVPEYGDGGGDLYDVLSLQQAPDFVALNDRKHPWRLTLDLRTQDDLLDHLHTKPDELLLEALCCLMHDGTTDQLARREWVLQLLQTDRVRVCLPTAAVVCCW